MRERLWSAWCAVAAAAYDINTARGALSWITHHQRNGSLNVVQVAMGGGGGLGSMLQVFSKQIVTGMIVKGHSQRVNSTGHFRWYTDNSGCGNSSFECWFEPLLSSPEIAGTEYASLKMDLPLGMWLPPGANASMPPFIANMDLSLEPTAVTASFEWFSAAQVFTFRPNTALRAAVRRIEVAFAFDGFPDVGALHHSPLPLTIVSTQACTFVGAIRVRKVARSQPTIFSMLQHVNQTGSSPGRSCQLSLS